MYGQKPRPGFTKATVNAWRGALEARLEEELCEVVPGRRWRVRANPAVAGACFGADHGTIPRDQARLGSCA